MTNDTKAPKRIWAVKEPDWHDGKGVSFLGGTWDAGHLKEGTPHIPEQDALDLVAAAYEDAAGHALIDRTTDEPPLFKDGARWHGLHTSTAIKNRTPTDAQAALEADRNRVREEALREAARIVRGWHDCGNKPGDFSVMRAEAEILALVRQDDSMVEGDTDE